MVNVDRPKFVRKVEEILVIQPLTGHPRRDVS